MSGGANKGSSVNSNRSTTAIFCQFKKTVTDKQTDRNEHFSVKRGQKTDTRPDVQPPSAQQDLNMAKSLIVAQAKGKYALKMGTSCLEEKPTDTVTYELAVMQSHDI